MENIFESLGDILRPSSPGCKCVNVEIGSYDNQIELTPPLHQLQYKLKQGGAPTICVDKCISDEISYLWSIGITTTGCCCGHKKLPAFIGVIESDIPRMKELGYIPQYNSCRPNDEDSFTPKSI